jgi:NAD-dependent SIR2 family protein deacetylase
MSTVRTVLFLGAGASRAFGYALTDEIMPEILARARRRSFLDGSLNRRSKHALSRLKELHAGLSRSAPSITEVLSLLDQGLRGDERFAASEGKMPIGYLRGFLEDAMAEILDVPLLSGRRFARPRQVTKWIRSKRYERGEVALITTNYDTSVDTEILWTLLDNWEFSYSAVDFGMPWRDLDDGLIVPPAGSDALVRLYKLHGSLNWLRCDRCGFIYVNFAANIAKLTREKCHCERKPLRSVLVAPSLVRDVREHNLLSIWRSALEVLRNAPEWVFIGYSLPSEDIAVRSLLLRAWLARARKPTVRVVDPDDDGSVEARYRGLFPRCRFANDGFKEFLRGKCRWRGPKKQRRRAPRRKS